MKHLFKTGSAVSLTALSFAFGATLPAFAEEAPAEDATRIEETIIVTSDASAAAARAAVTVPRSSNVVGRGGGSSSSRRTSQSESGRRSSTWAIPAAIPPAGPGLPARPR